MCTGVTVAERAAEAIMRSDGRAGRPANRPGRTSGSKRPHGISAASGPGGNRSTGSARGDSNGKAASPHGGEGPTPEEEALFQRLRALRKELADEQGVPAYIVFSDKVLREMAATQPSTPSELLAVSGVGPVKLERYGAEFLQEIVRGS